MNSFSRFSGFNIETNDRLFSVLEISRHAGHTDD